MASYSTLPSRIRQCGAESRYEVHRVGWGLGYEKDIVESEFLKFTKAD